MKDRLLWFGCAAYAAVFIVLGAIKYSAHRNLVDFGIFAQTIVSAFGCFCNPLEGSHWAFHFSPILYLVALPVAVTHVALTLIVVQSIAGALCAPPVYAIVRRRCDRATARTAALVVWLYPPLAGLTFGDFHENVFAPAAVAWTMYAFDAGLLRWAALGVAVTLAVKEDQAVFLAVTALGAAWWYRGDRRRARFALGSALISLTVVALFFVAIQPHAATNAAWRPERFYAWTQTDWRQLGRQLPARFGFLLLVFAPLAFLPLRTPAALLTAAPLVEVLASRMSTTYTMGTHYAGAWIGYVLTAFAAGVASLASRVRVHPALLWAVGVCVLALLVANPLHPGLNLRLPQRRDRALDSVLHVLPPGMSLATQEEAYTHLALDDPLARLLPEDARTPTQACLVLIDHAFPQSPRLVEYGPALEALVRSHRYVLVARSDGIELYRRTTLCR